MKKCGSFFLDHLIKECSSSRRADGRSHDILFPPPTHRSSQDPQMLAFGGGSWIFCPQSPQHPSLGLLARPHLQMFPVCRSNGALRWSFAPLAHKQHSALLAGNDKGANPRMVHKALVMGPWRGRIGGSTGWAGWKWLRAQLVEIRALVEIRVTKTGPTVPLGMPPDLGWGHS